MIRFSEGFVFYPCEGHPKLGWRIANEAVVLTWQEARRGPRIELGELVYLACTGVRRAVDRPAENLPVLPFEIDIQEVGELRGSRAKDCKDRERNGADTASSESIRAR